MSNSNLNSFLALPAYRWNFLSAQSHDISRHTGFLLSFVKVVWVLSCLFSFNMILLHCLSPSLQTYKHLVQQWYSLRRSILLKKDESILHARRAWFYRNKYKIDRCRQRKVEDNSWDWIEERVFQVVVVRQWLSTDLRKIQNKRHHTITISLGSLSLCLPSKGHDCWSRCILANGLWDLS